MDISSVLIGAVLGFLSGLGVGGGSLLMVWLTAVKGADPAEAGLVNLLFFVPAALLSTVFRRGCGKLPWKKVGITAAAGCAASAAGSLLRTAVSPDFLRPCLGILMIFSGIRELCYRSRNAR